MDRLLDLTRQAEGTHFWYRGFRFYVEPVLASLTGKRPGLRILDLGCGTGHNLELLSAYGRSVGFDLSAASLVMAREAGKQVARADASRVPFAADTFDLVTSFDVMQCTPRDREAVQEMARVLKPGGRAVITMAALRILHGDHSEVWQEYRRYDRASARALAEQAGLHVERVSYMFASVFPLMLAARSWQRLTRPYRAVRDDTDISVPAAPINAALTSVLQMEAALARYVPMPVGSSLLVVASKP
jgi:ubiquinone/menaquinone biosynthesis C-methylase UbiE